jgi:TIR domain
LAVDFNHDVFISYAHADNGVPVGSSVPHGWVTALAANLNVGPNVLKKNLFIDHQLRPGDDFSTELLSRVKQSSVLVLLLSQNYIDSKWCGSELEHFVSEHSLDPAQPLDVFVVELFPFKEFTNVPDVITQLRRRKIDAKFWYQPLESADANLAGFPSAHESGKAGETHYWSVLNALRAALDTRLRTIHLQRRTPGVPLPRTPAATPASPLATKPKLGTVLLADTTDDLEAQRNAVRLALEPEGILVLPEGDYVGLTPAEFEAAIASDLARSDLFVQLLSPTPGRKPKGQDAPLAQLQYQRASHAKLPILQWCERLPSADEITDPAHSELFRTSSIRATYRTNFESTVIEQLRAQKQAQAQARAAEQTETNPSKKWIFLDDAAGEAALSDRLRSVIREQNFQVRSLPAGTPLGNNGIDIKEMLRPCRAGITVYADRAMHTTAFNRLVYFLNQVADGSLPLARWGVLLNQGTVASEFGITSDEVVPLSERGLAEFLSGL